MKSKHVKKRLIVSETLTISFNNFHDHHRPIFKDIAED